MTSRPSLFGVYPEKLTSVGSVTEKLDFRSRFRSQSSMQGATTEIPAKAKQLREKP